MLSRFGGKCRFDRLRTEVHWISWQRFFSTHRATFQRVNISRAKELFEQYSESTLPEYVTLNETPGNAFKVTISKLGTSELEFELRDSVALLRFSDGENSFNADFLTAVEAALDRAIAILRIVLCGA